MKQQQQQKLNLIFIVFIDIMNLILGKEEIQFLFQTKFGGFTSYIIPLTERLSLGL